MADAHFFTPILGKRIRVTEMNTDGSVGANYVTTDGFITATLSSSIEAGTEIIQRNAAGILCVNELLASNFKRFTVDIEFCGVNPALVPMVTLASGYEDYAGDTAGFAVSEGLILGFFALEIWTGLSGSVYDDSANGYFLLPFVNFGNLADIKIAGDAAVTFELTNAYTVGGNQWGTGPYDVVYNGPADSGEPDSGGSPAPLPTPVDPLDHMLLIDTAVPAPVVQNTPTAVAA